MANWNATYLTKPLNTDSPAAGDDEIRDVKDAVEERAELEHFWDSADTTTTAGGASGHGWHREGSAKAYYQAAAPTTRPDPGTTALDSNDEGRLWIDSDTDMLLGYSGSAWVELTKTYMRWSVEGTLAVATDIQPRIVVPRAGVIKKVTLHAKTAPTDAALIVDINDGGGTSVFTTRPQIAAAANAGSSTDIAAAGTLVAEEDLRVDIDQVGSTVAGADLTITVEYAPA